MATFTKWVDALVSEKGITGRTIEIQGASGVNHMPLEVVIDAIKQAPKHEQAQFKNVLVAIDFKNGDIMHFFKHLAGAIAI